jgi:hypothetical protein
MSVALYALQVAGVWFIVCCLFALGACIVQAAREVIRERNADQ